MNRQQHPKNATTNAVRRPMTTAQLVMLNTKKIQEMRRQRYIFTWTAWGVIILMVALINTGHRHQQAAHEAAQVCKEYNAAMEAKNGN